MAKTMSPVDLEPIDRLEEKVKRLVTLVDRLRGDQQRALDDNQRLTKELDAMRSRIADADGRTNEITTLRQERDVIRSRVAEMLEQLEALNL